MAEMIRENLPMIATMIFVFMMGMGIGAAITDAINKEEKNDSQD